MRSLGGTLVIWMINCVGDGLEVFWVGFGKSGMLKI
jgi:hypothetical protein